MTKDNDTPALVGATRRKTVRLGRRFAGELATHLGANVGSQDAKRLEDESRILSLMRDVLKLAEPDPVAVNFITHAVEVHTSTYGFSQVIYDELFRLHQERLKRATAGAPDPAEPRKPTPLAKSAPRNGPVTLPPRPRSLKA